MPGDPADQLALYREYRQHNELGLAFDVLVGLAQERRAPAECWQALREAVREMGLTATDSVHGRAAAVVRSQRL